jgi:hypothetical protein
MWRGIDGAMWIHCNESLCQPTGSSRYIVYMILNGSLCFEVHSPCLTVKQSFVKFAQILYVSLLFLVTGALLPSSRC